MTFWANYYLGLSSDSLLFFTSKSNTPSKVVSGVPVSRAGQTEVGILLS